jgi:hypothetical protein
MSLREPIAVLAVLLAGCTMLSPKTGIDAAPTASERDLAVEAEIHDLYAKDRKPDAVTFGRVVLMSAWSREGDHQRREAAIGVRDKDGECYFAMGWVNSAPGTTHVASYFFPGRSRVECKDIY